MPKKEVWVVIPAAGIGQRMQSDIPKQYLKINNKTILEHTLNCFLYRDEVVGILVVLAPHDEYWNSLSFENTSLKETLFTTNGGKDRAESVLCGLDYLFDVQKLSPDSWVMVHDAARPCLSSIDLDSLLELCCSEEVGGLLASPVKDTMKRSEVLSGGDNRVMHTESRDGLWHAQTPQMFRLNKIKFALEECQKSGFNVTDECSAMEYVGESPLIIESLFNNVKVTNPADIKLVEYLLNENSKAGEKCVKSR